MPRVNRVEIFADDEIQVFHLVNRCVRRTYLCGRDEETGRDYSHRKQWIRDRLEVLAGIFAVDILSFAVMSNHLHVVARTRPDIVKKWSDDEVALRWAKECYDSPAFTQVRNRYIAIYQQLKTEHPGPVRQQLVREAGALRDMA